MQKEKLIKRKIKFGKEILGPIFYEFCFKLMAYINTQDPKKTIVLYQSRGGLRLRYLFNMFIKNNKINIECLQKDFFISRLAVINGCLSLDFDYVYSVLINKKRSDNIKNIISAFLERNVSSNELFGFNNFKEVYFSESELGVSLREHFCKQSRMFKLYFQEITENMENIILVDSGWVASTQGILMHSFSNKNFIGTYFGKWDYDSSNPWYFSSVNGLSVENNSYNFFNKRGSILHYHHLIEDILEPEISSVKKYNKYFIDAKLSKNFEDDKNILEKEEDFLFKGIISYFEQTQNKSISKVYKEATLAYNKLSKKILFPKKEDVLVMAVGKRSHDFGNDGEAPVNLVKSVGFSLKPKIKNIRQSLWKQGQIRIEFGFFASLFLWAYYLYYFLKNKGKIVL